MNWLTSEMMERIIESVYRNTPNGLLGIQNNYRISVQESVMLIRKEEWDVLIREAATAMTPRSYLICWKPS